MAFGMDKLLAITDLAVTYRRSEGKESTALCGVSLDILQGEVIGVLGESGCGKTTLGLSILRILPAEGRIVRGTALYHGADLFRLAESRLERIRGAEIAMVHQEPGIALHPVMRVGEQIGDVLRVHRGWPRGRCRDEVEALLRLVRLEDTGRIYAAFPHELSGGQRQRALIAMAVACRPALVIADEPTASLDSTVQAEILDLFKELKTRFQLSILWISHQPAVLAQIADRVVVIYAGRIVEEGMLKDVFQNPLHPYTKALLESQPQSPAEAAAVPRPRLRVAGNERLDSARLSRGCPFEPRCADHMEVCRTREPEEIYPETSRRVRCFKYGG